MPRHCTAALCLILCIVLAVFDVRRTAAQISCGGWTTCSACTVEGGCGWCGASGTCEAGNATNSFQDCSNESWAWLERNCSITPDAPSSDAPITPAPPVVTCSNVTDCDTCTVLPGCGWCTENNECQSGNATSSQQGCALPYWSWTIYQCPVAPRSLCNYENGYCHSCIANSGCGYCKTTGVCESGSELSSATGDCSGGGWVWGENSTSCPSYTRFRRN